MKLTVNQIASLFDEIDEEYLTPFDWNPNEKLPNHGRTYRLKDRFIVKFNDLECIYTNLDHCRIKFHAIFYDNIIYVYQCKDLIEKIKKLTDAEKYDSINTNRSMGNNVTKGSSNTSTLGSETSYTDDKDGQISGVGEATTLDTAWNARSNEIIKTSDLLDKKENAIMQFLDPNLRQITQGFEREKSVSANLSRNTNFTNNTNQNVYNSISSYTQKIEAYNEQKALMAHIPRLVDQFLECFNILFYY